MGVREEQKEKRRNEILNAALDLFISKGYAATKVNDIAERVGMSTGLMFHYFKSKENLYVELIKLGIGGPVGVMSFAAGMEPLGFFEEAARRVLGSIRDDPFTAKMFVLMNEAFRSEAAPQSVRNMLSSFDIFTPTAALIKKGQENSTIRDGDPAALATAYWCAINGIAELIAVNPELQCPESKWIVDIIRRK